MYSVRQDLEERTRGLVPLLGIDLAPAVRTPLVPGEDVGRPGIGPGRLLTGGADDGDVTVDGGVCKLVIRLGVRRGLLL